jgi:hypothetical protein
MNSGGQIWEDNFAPNTDTMTQTEKRKHSLMKLMKSWRVRVNVTQALPKNISVARAEETGREETIAITRGTRNTLSANQTSTGIVGVAVYELRRMTRILSVVTIPLNNLRTRNQPGPDTDQEPVP